jgi:hypothetical protein
MKLTIDEIQAKAIFYFDDFYIADINLLGIVLKRMCGIKGIGHIGCLDLLSRYDMIILNYSWMSHNTIKIYQH